MKNSHSLFISVLFSLVFSLVISGFATGCASRKPSSPTSTTPALQALVLMTDFGLADGAVSAMKGVARETAPGVAIFDLTHEIPPYNIWEAAYRLSQTYKYWPRGTVFVSVIDPGVGSERHSVAIRTKSGHIFVGPDNGLSTFIEEQTGIEQIAIIDETKQRLKGSEDSYTFHGRDLYVYVGARLAAGIVTLDQLGAKGDSLIKLPYQKAEFAKGAIQGNIPVLDPNYGNVWTNIPKALFETSLKGAKKVRVRIPKAGFDQVLPVEATFAGAPKGQPLVYFNSLLNVSLALNQGDFAKRFKIKSGADWQISVTVNEGAH